MTDCNLSAVWFRRMHDQQSLTLSWHSFSRWGRERVVIILPIKVANTWNMYNNKQINFKLTDLYDLQLLMLRWRSLCHGFIHNMQSFNLVQSISYIVLAAFLAFTFTFFLITTLFFNHRWIYTIIISKIPFLSVNACHQLQDRSMHSSGL
jgi:hypothetical protein